MRARSKTSRLLRSILNLATVAALLLGYSGQAIAATTYPWLAVTGGDVATGGWFNDDTNNVPCNGSGYYQAPDWANSKYKIGGILTFAGYGSGTRGGSHSDYAAYSLGLIENGSFNTVVNGSSTSVSAGFYTGSTNSSNLQQLSFANYYAVPPSGLTSNLGGGGGLLEGNGGTFTGWHCIPDYYDDYKSSTAPAVTTVSGNTASSINLDTLCNSTTCSTHQFVDTVPTGTVATITSNTPGGSGSGYVIPKGKKLSLYINGDVYINTNTNYDSTADVTNIPNLTLVVRGNVYVGNNITQLTGIYVAQPLLAADASTGRNPANTGQFWTCQSSTGSWVTADFGVNCKAKTLNVDGSVIAAQVFPTRLYTAAFFPNITTPAEQFNYTPQAAIGGSFSSSSSSGSTSQASIDSLVSLPPVF